MNKAIAAVVCAVLGLVSVAGMARGAEPEFKTQPLRPFVERDGLGHFFAKLHEGKPVTIAYLGGSITAMPGWRTMTLKWFQDRYPRNKITGIPAAIGGTGSNLGVFRLDHDVLRYKPDLLFVEFAVNDGGTKPANIWEAMEGIVRKTWRALPDCDICFVYTISEPMLPSYLKSECPRSTSADEVLADHYGIPSVNMGYEVAKMFEAGKLVMKKADAKPGVIVFSPEGVHPYPPGHKVYTEEVAAAMRKMEADAKKPVDHAEQLGTPFVAGNWENAKIVPLDGSMLRGWTKLPANHELNKRFESRTGPLWMAEKPGATLRFRFRGSSAMLYDLLGPDGGRVDITVDGKKAAHPAQFFDHYCTYYRIGSLSLARDLDPSKVHEVAVTLRADQPNRSSVTDRVKDKPGFNPKTYDGTRAFAGAILLRGDVVK